MNKFLIFITLIFSVSILAGGVDPSKLPAAVKKALNRFLPKANPDNCSWELWANEKGYFGKCKLVEGDESSPNVNFDVGKNGQNPSATYTLESTQFSGHIDQKMLEAAGKSFTKLEGTETEPDSVRVKLGAYGKVQSYIFFHSSNDIILQVQFSAEGKQIGKALRLGRGG